MSSIGLVISIDGAFNRSHLETIICSNLDDCKDKLIGFLSGLFYGYYISQLPSYDIKYTPTEYFPHMLDAFNDYWFYPRWSTNETIFRYKIIINNEWIKPWTDREIYESVRTNIINKH